MDYTGDLHAVIYDSNPATPRCPERALLEAVLLRALLDLSGSLGAVNSSVFGSIKYHEYTRALQRDAAKWVFRGRPRDEGITFIMCCEGLGLCPEAVRDRVRHLLRQPDGLRSRIARIKTIGPRRRVCKASQLRECN